MSEWPIRRWLVAFAVGAVVAAAVGIPTGVLATPFYTRMTPVLWWNYPIWLFTAVLSGLVAATYVRSRIPPTTRSAGLWATLASAFAVGCPVCNKLIVALLGVSGALSIWAPLQPVIAVASLSLLAWALRRRLAGERACAILPAVDGRAIEADPARR
ncbi:hypothetical protein IU436_26390 [Nocardia farcinica]|nr:hypothetical protein [Nocardia cyriacigeorgica]MBF6422219.1 hypothetical protein [Nocardia farcinica]MBF6433875.1 hypothetical protein [Nocardia farcinica]MBF6504943.1 hypothetical protein [Nocardia farcinica]